MKAQHSTAALDKLAASHARAVAAAIEAERQLKRLKLLPADAMNVVRREEFERLEDELRICRSRAGSLAGQIRANLKRSM